MAMPSDLEIARQAHLKPIAEIAKDMGIEPRLLEHYGESVAKIKLDAIAELADRPKAKYVVVSAITPTPLGEGKTTTVVGLGQAMHHIGKRATISIRQPSMGPTFGIKGGAAGGGYSQAVPMESFNLHLTGDMHAVTAAHNMLSAMVDNHLQKGNELKIDLHNITWRRVLDVNDRALRNIVIGLGSKLDGVPRQTGFDITAASEVMAILALSTSLKDMRARLGRIVVGYTDDGEPVTSEDLKGAGAMTVIMREAIKPNLLQTIENTPVIVHAGPFGNIAHGNSSIVGDLIGIHTGDFLLTEAGFGADMGAERFFDIKCRTSGLRPDAAVRRGHGACAKGPFRQAQGRRRPALAACHLGGEPRGGPSRRGQPAQADREHPGLRRLPRRRDQRVSRGLPFRARGHPGDRGLHGSAGRGVHQLRRGRQGSHRARASCGRGGRGADRLPLALPERGTAARRRSRAVATKIYGAAGVDYLPAANRQIDAYEKNGYGNLPVIIAKTHLSLSSDPALKGAPTGWRMPVREARASVGAGFVYLICGDMSTMPGLSTHPAAEIIDIDENGEIVGLS